MDVINIFQILMIMMTALNVSWCVLEEHQTVFELQKAVMCMNILQHQWWIIQSQMKNDKWKHKRV